jgi:hypothetical protein
MDPHSSAQVRRTGGRSRRALVAAAATLVSFVAVAAVDASAAGALPGSGDTSYGASGTATQAASAVANGIAIDPNPGMTYQDAVVAGTDDTSFQVGRFTTAGVADPAFGNSGLVTLFPGDANAVAVVPAGLPHAGDIVAVGSESVPSSAPVHGCYGNVPVVVELTPSGAEDTSFGTGGVALIGESSPSPPGTPGTAALCSTSTTFVANDGALTGVVVDGAGNVVVGGQILTGNGTLEALAARLTPTGAADTAFQSGGFAQVQIGTSNFSAGGIVLAPVGSATDLLLAGTSYAFGSAGQPSQVSHLTVAAFPTASGATGLDPSYDPSGATPGVATSATAGSIGQGITALPAPAASGAVVVAGFSGSPTPSSLLTYMGPTGTSTSDFGQSSGATYSGVTTAPGGLLIAAGSTGSSTGQEMQLAEFNDTVVPLVANPSFGSKGVITRSYNAGASSLAAVATQADGKAVGAGIAPTVNQAPAMGLVRWFGPSASVGNAQPVTVKTNAPIAGTTSVTFPVSLDEKLFAPITANFCLTNLSACGSTSFGSGATSTSVTVSAVPYAAPFGSQTTSSVGAAPPTLATAGGALTGGVAQGAIGSVTVTHLQVPHLDGYWLVASDGGIFNYDHPFEGSAGNIALVKPIVGMAGTPDSQGYWLVASDGGIFNYGDAGFHGSAGNIALVKPIVGMAGTPDGLGYWLVASDGGIFTYGDAGFHGSAGNIPLVKPIVGMASTPDGRGYWLVASDGGIFTFGDAGFYGSAGNIPLSKPIVGMASTPDGRGYWLVASDGGIFTFGDAGFYGSAGNLPLAKPVVGMATSPDGGGYWMVASDGGIFNYGDAHFWGSAGNIPLVKPIVGMGT